ncbi:MAG: radical SAM protein, partial [Deltaproteobacteria bacterium]|nr:radical SAM protein [Deltaproteobacteria bacterium]
NSAMNYSPNSVDALKYVLELKRKGKKVRVASAIEVYPVINPGLLFEVLKLWEEISNESEVEVGIQSLNRTVLENINRGLDLAVMEKLFDYAKKSTLIFAFDLIIGLPGDNFFSFCKSLKFVMGRDAGHVNTPRLRLYKNTPLFDRTKEFGIEFGKWPFFKVTKTRSFSKRALDKAELISGAAKSEYCTDYYSGKDVEFNT